MEGEMTERSDDADEFHQYEVAGFLSDARCFM